MSVIGVRNALLRIDGTIGEPQPPFERPNSEMSFWVLELETELELTQWCSVTMELLRLHAEYLDSLRCQGCGLTLFISPSGTDFVCRFEASFLKQLGDMGISLEIEMPFLTD
jgi:hypothetical protein